MKPIFRHELRHGDGRRLWVYGTLGGQLPMEPAPDSGERSSRVLHQRYDALTDSWIAVSPARNVRPDTTSDTAVATNMAAPAPMTARPETSACPLCPGGPEVPFPYDAAVFENRWPSLVAHPPSTPDPADPWQAPSLGRCEVVLYSPSHVGSLATLTPDELARLVAVWVDRTTALWAEPSLRFVMAFENRGAMVGATIAHPHGQLYGFDRLPPQIERRTRILERHRATHGNCLTCDVVVRDLVARERAVDSSDAFTVAVPFAPRWPYEIHVRARKHGIRRMSDLSPVGRQELARLLRRVVLRYDRLFGFDLPYMMTILEAPEGALDHHLAVEFLPPQRSASQVKVRASVETATGLFINDTMPEASADALGRIPVESQTEAPAVHAVPASPLMT